MAARVGVPIWRNILSRRFVRALGSIQTPVYCARRLLSTVEDLEKTKQRLNVLTEDPGNDAKLKLYGLYKQVGFFQVCDGVSLEPSFFSQP